jgi:hypothetical protein
VTPGGAHHRVLAGIVERVARSPQREAFVLRGGVLTRHLVAPAPRPARDLDYVGDFAFDVADTAARFAAASGVVIDDGVCIDAASLRVEPLWLHSAFPGVRLVLAAGLDAADREFTVDVGFNDPLVPPAIDVTFQGTTGEIAVRAVRAETQLAWKLHGLAEHGAGFRPKDLHDAHLIATRCRLDDAALDAALAAAFASRGYPREAALGVLTAAHWATKTARVRWSHAQPLDRVVAELRARLDHVLAALGEWERARPEAVAGRS